MIGLNVTKKSLQMLSERLQKLKKENSGWCFWWRHYENIRVLDLNRMVWLDWFWLDIVSMIGICLYTNKPCATWGISCKQKGGGNHSSWPWLCFAFEELFCDYSFQMFEAVQVKTDQRKPFTTESVQAHMPNVKI
jgi:hypothetical protein